MNLETVKCIRLILSNKDNKVERITVGLDWCSHRHGSKYVSGMENIDRGRAYSTNILKFLVF